MWLSLNIYHKSGHLCCKGIFMVGLKHKNLQTDHLLCGRDHILCNFILLIDIINTSQQIIIIVNTFSHMQFHSAATKLFRKRRFFCDTCQKLVAKIRHFSQCLSVLPQSTVFLSQIIMIDPSCFARATSCFLIVVAMNAESSFDRSCFLDMLQIYFRCLSLNLGTKQIDILLKKFLPNHEDILHKIFHKVRISRCTVSCT